jgi:hypothetical protein
MMPLQKQAYCCWAEERLGDEAGDEIASMDDLLGGAIGGESLSHKS